MIVSALLIAACAPRQVSFHKDVALILQRNCATWHGQNGAGYLQGGFSVESFGALLKGVKDAAMIDPGSERSEQSGAVAEAPCASADQPAEDMRTDGSGG